jgi:hypothetical protein
LNFTTEVETKFDPVTTREKAGPPAVALVGEMEVVAGTGLVTLKLTAVEVPPPGAGFVTVTGKEPAVAMSVAVMDAVMAVELMNVVALALPLKLTTAPLTKPVPVTLNMNAPLPTLAEVGLRIVTVGAGLLMVNDKFPDVPPPGAGFMTVTFTVPAVRMAEAGMVAVN